MLNTTSVNIKTPIGRRYLTTNQNLHLLIGVLDHTRHDASSTLDPRSQDYRVEILLGANSYDSLDVKLSFDQILNSLKNVFMV